MPATHLPPDNNVVLEPRALNQYFSTHIYLVFVACALLCAFRLLVKQQTAVFTLPLWSKDNAKLEHPSHRRQLDFGKDSRCIWRRSPTPASRVSQPTTNDQGKSTWGEVRILKAAYLLLPNRKPAPPRLDVSGCLMGGSGRSQGDRSESRAVSSTAPDSRHQQQEQGQKQHRQQPQKHRRPSSSPSADAGDSSSSARGGSSRSSPAQTPSQSGKQRTKSGSGTKKVRNKGTLGMEDPGSSSDQDAADGVQQNWLVAFEEDSRSTGNGAKVARSRLPAPLPVISPVFPPNPFTFENRRPGYAASEPDATSIAQRQPSHGDTGSAGETAARRTMNPVLDSTSVLLRQQTITRTVPIGIPIQFLQHGRRSHGSRDHEQESPPPRKLGGPQELTRSYPQEMTAASSYPPTSPLLPPPPLFGESEDDEEELEKGENFWVSEGEEWQQQQRGLEMQNPTSSVLDDTTSQGWPRHTRVYGGGVCLACEAAAASAAEISASQGSEDTGDGSRGAEHGAWEPETGGFYGENVPMEERRRR